jgi:predicted DsbA family dithiol-disulfide isomerase
LRAALSWGRRVRNRRESVLNDRLTIDYFSDVLCVWAWIAQRRIDEMNDQWGETVRLGFHCVDVFGDAGAKVAAGWSARGGYEGFAQHVREVAIRYEAPAVHEYLWTKVRPVTSGTAHLVLKATEIAESPLEMTRLSRALREAFFVDARDVGDLGVCLEVAQGLGLAAAELKRHVDSGAAMAALLADYRKAEERGIRGSPSWVMNEGRQVLYGGAAAPPGTGSQLVLGCRASGARPQAPKRGCCEQGLGGESAS